MKRSIVKKYLLPAILSGAVIFCFGASGEICGPLFETTADAFGDKFPENQADDLEKVTSKVKTKNELAISNASGNPLVIMTTKPPQKGLMAWNLKSAKKQWFVQMSVNSPVSLRNNTIIVQSGFDIAVLSADTGEEHWRVPIEEGWEYYGADIDGDTIVLSLGIGSSDDGAYANGKLIALRLSDGREIWQNLTGNGLLGKPAAKDGFVFVPWKKKQIAVISIKSGEEVSRIRADDYTVNFVKSTPQGVFYGTNATKQHIASLFRLDTTSITGKRVSSNRFTPEIAPVPNFPGFDADAFNKPSLDLSTADRIRFYWLAQKNTTPFQFFANAYYLHYWRYVISFDALSHQVRWAYMSKEDLQTLHVVEQGVYSLTTTGKIQFIDGQTGEVKWERQTGATPTAAVFDTYGYRPKYKSAGATPNPRADLKNIVKDRDHRMLPVRIYATELLSDIDSPHITADLLGLYADATLPSALQQYIVEKISERESGADALVASLHQEYDFLTQTAAPPMNVIAPALAHMEAHDALGGLTKQLTNYETPTSSIEPIAAAILSLGDVSIIETLSNFVIMYHADSSFIGNEAALAKVCEIILKYGSQKERELVAHIRDESQTLPELKNQLLIILDPKADEKAMALAIKKAQEAEIAKQKALKIREAQEVANRPYFLTRDEIARTIHHNARFLRPCIKNALEKRLSLLQVRMKFSITGSTGKAIGVQILPGDIPGLQQCLSDGMTQITFPKFKSMRQSASHTIRITGVRRATPEAD